MTGFRNPLGVARLATIALYSYMVLDVLLAVVRWLYPLSEGPMDGTAPADLASLPWLVSLLACLVFVGRWIYVSSANAHVFSDAMAISPGWAVGWLFVPLANLVMPYQAMRETWRESHEAAGSLDEMDTPIVGLWWGLWLATNFLGNLSVMFGGGTAEPLEGAIYVDLLSSLLNVALCLVLVRMIKRLSRTQIMASEGSVFA